MKKYSSKELIAGCFIAIMSYALMTAYLDRNNCNDSAVKHHAAEYYLDSNHNRQFRWLDEKPSVEIKP